TGFASSHNSRGARSRYAHANNNAEIEGIGYSRTEQKGGDVARRRSGIRRSSSNNEIARKTRITGFRRGALAGSTRSRALGVLAATQREKGKKGLFALASERCAS